MKKIFFLFKSNASINTIFFFLYKKLLNIFFKKKSKIFKLLHKNFLKKKKITLDYFSLNAYNFYLCISKLKKNFKYLEIGSYEGNSALFVESNFNNAKIYCVDTWAGSSEHVNHDFKIIEKNFNYNIKNKKNIKKIKSTSDKFFSLNKIMFDVIYIDGNHNASQVYLDCNNAWRCLKKNGYLICDDYFWQNYSKIKENPCFAINKFLNEIKKSYKLINISNNQIFIEKIN
jgi:hypothetical protein